MSFRRWFQRISAPFLEKTPSVYAACAVFYFLISIFPTSAFLLSVMTHFPDTSIFLLKQFFLIMPEPLHDVFVQILMEVNHRTTPALLSISGLLSLWSSSKGIQTVMNGLRFMMDLEDTGNWIKRRLRAMIEFLFVQFLLIGTAAMGLYLYRTFCSFSKFLLPVLLLFPALLWFLYRWQSLGQISYFVCWLSACAASIAVFLYSYAYSIYIRYFSSYDDFWGNMGIIVLGMIWLHGSLVMILIGSRFSKLLQDETQRSCMGIIHAIYRLFK